MTLEVETLHGLEVQGVGAPPLALDFYMPNPQPCATCTNVSARRDVSSALLVLGDANHEAVAFAPAQVLGATDTFLRDAMRSPFTPAAPGAADAHGAGVGA
jgi:hypothetical protein